MTYSRASVKKDFFNTNMRSVVLAASCATIYSILNILLLLGIGRFYELHFGGNSAKGSLLQQFGILITDLNAFLIWFFSLILLRFCFHYLQHIYTSKSEEKASQFFRNHLFQAQLNQNTQSFNLKPPGYYLLRYTGDLTAIQQLISKGYIRLAADIAIIGFASMILISICATLTLYVCLLLALSLLVSLLLSRMLSEPDNLRKKAKSSFVNFVDTRLNAMTTIKIFNRKTPEINSFEKKTTAIYEASISFQKTNALSKSFLNLILYLTIGFVMIYVAKTNDSQSIQESEIIIYILILLYVQGSVRRLLRMPIVFKGGNDSLDNILQILNLPQEKSDHTNDGDIKFNQIQIKDLSFGYKQENLLLKSFSADFKQNSINVITGPHNSGKSSLFRVLLALHPYEIGSIKLDQTELKELQPFNIRKNISYIGNDAPLIGTTVFAAISYNKKSEKRQKAIELLKKLNITFDADENRNLDYYIGNSGSKISSSQQKLLMFARMFLTNKNIMLIDDPAKDLDEDSWKRIAAMLNTLKSKKTIIVASNHIPSDLKIDKIIQI